MAGRNLERVADQPECVVEFSRIQGQHAKEVQTVTVTRIGIQDFPVEALGFIQASSAVTANSPRVTFLGTILGRD
jgi:hypothetical protein